MAVLALGAVVAALLLVIDSVSSSTHTRHPPQARAERGSDDPRSGLTAQSHQRAPHSHARAAAAGSYGVGTTTLQLTDPTRTITLPGGRVVPRPVTTVVRYPTLRSGNGAPAHSRQPARVDGPFPLIIFGHGFDLMPGAYARLLDYWTSAGFVVAAPIFPLESLHAPGGPNESDLPNQPQDMRFVMSRLLRFDAQPGGLLTGLIDRHQVAVAGHSDGGDTALALAYDPSLRDPHLQAAVILSGAEIPMLPTFQIPAGGPPLLATQGTADTINLPSATASYFDTAPSPKYLLRLLGGSHIGPYATNRLQLAVVERVTTAFLQHYLDDNRAALRRMSLAGNVTGVATLQSDQ